MRQLVGKIVTTLMNIDDWLKKVYVFIQFTQK